MGILQHSIVVFVAVMGIGNALQCYVCFGTTREQCDAMRRPVTCPPGYWCRTIVQTKAAVFGGGISLVLRGCWNSSLCQDSNNCTVDFRGPCIRCCDSDMCNEGNIDFAFATPTMQPTPPTPITPTTGQSRDRSYSNRFATITGDRGTGLDNRMHGY